METPNPESVEALALQDLNFRAIAPDDVEGQDNFYRAVARGFLKKISTNEDLEQHRRIQQDRRTLAIYDPHTDITEIPVATITDWPTEMTTPGGSLPIRAITSVTVAATHRRRGIARAMLEGELRDAAANGVAALGLTVSEGSIYGRYGFAPATWESMYTIDTRRAGWNSAVTEPAGRVDYVHKSELPGYLRKCIAACLEQKPGSFMPSVPVCEQLAGAVETHPHKDRIRGVVYRDENGELHGAMSYDIETTGAWERSEFRILTLAADTPEAKIALMKFAIQHDLIGEVKWDDAPVDFPLHWYVADPFAITATREDGHWLRVVDTPATLTSRRYAAPLDCILTVEDSLGFASGTWRITTRPADPKDTDYEPVDGEPLRSTGLPYELEVTEADESSDLPVVTLDVRALGAVILGGTRVSDIASAGLASGTSEVLGQLDIALVSPEAPHLHVDY